MLDDQVRAELRDLPDVPVPAVPKTAGPRFLGILGVLAGLLGAGCLLFTIFYGSVALADVVGLADTSTAVVTERTWETSGQYSRGCHSWNELEVAWDDRTGNFSVCVIPHHRAADLDVGDEVVVTSVPWSSAVIAEGGNDGELPFAGIELVAGVFLTALAVAYVRRARRLALGRAEGVRLTGTVATFDRRVNRVRLDTPGFEGRTLEMLRLKRVPPGGTGDAIEVWSTRRSWFRHRPRGPWVVRFRGAYAVFTHAWLKRR